MTGPLDVVRVRADTPGCERVAHLNNAGAALPPRIVVEIVTSHLAREAAAGAYEAGEDAVGACEDVYSSIARLVGCAREEIAFAESATRAWVAAFSSLRFGPGDRLLTSRVEYASNYIALLQTARRTGAALEAVPSLPTGEVDVDALAGMLDHRVKLVAVTHVPTQSGLVNPAAEIGALTRAAGVPFLLDACQSVGQMPVDVEAIGCDFLSCTGRKFLRGPRGTGFLYVRDSLLDRHAARGEPLEPFGVDLHGATWSAAGGYDLQPGARRFEQWERSVACFLGLGAAVDYALDLGLDAIRDRVYPLAAQLREQLASLPGVTVRDEGVERCGIVTFTLAGHDPADLRRQLRASGVNVSVAVASSARLDMDARGIPAVVRASVHYYNTEEEIERLCALLPPPT